MKPIWLVRWVLPFGIIVAGFVLIGRSPEGLAEAVICAGVLVLVSNWILRIGFSDSADRDRDERAREFYDEHGHWPGESPDGVEEGLGEQRLDDERRGRDR